MLTLSRALSFPLGAWWIAVVQVHGHLQLYGWVSLFVVGVALHFLPRLRGVPLVGARFLPALLTLVVASLIMRTLCQPELVIIDTLAWRIGLIGSGVGETAAFLGLLTLFVLTAR